MDFNALLIGVAIVLGIQLGAMLYARIPGLFQDKSHLNATADWTPGRPEQQQKAPSLTSLVPYELRLITSHLEEGERLEGFGRAFFVPHRAREYRFGGNLEKTPLLVAATSRRILLFEVTLLTVHRFCFIGHDQIEFLQPPKPGMLGTTGRMGFGLR